MLVPGGIGYLPQSLELPGTATVTEAIDLALAGLGFPGLARDRTLGTLSGGQRSRSALAATLAAAPEVLLLDEPTNHLSPVLVEQLEQALTGYRGALVVVTHDRRIRERFRGTRLEIRDGVCPDASTAAARTA